MRVVVLLRVDLPPLVRTGRALDERERAIDAAVRSAEPVLRRAAPSIRNLCAAGGALAPLIGAEVDDAEVGALRACPLVAGLDEAPSIATRSIYDDCGSCRNGDHARCSADLRPGHPTSRCACAEAGHGRGIQQAVPAPALALAVSEDEARALWDVGEVARDDVRGTTVRVGGQEWVVLEWVSRPFVAVGPQLRVSVAAQHGGRLYVADVGVHRRSGSYVAEVSRVQDWPLPELRTLAPVVAALRGG